MVDRFKTYSYTELENIVLHIIGLLDYDMQKEIEDSLLENGFNSEIDEIIEYMVEVFGD